MLENGLPKIASKSLILFILKMQITTEKVSIGIEVFQPSGFSLCPKKDSAFQKFNT
jgi:hypothetical protein